MDGCKVFVVDSESTEVWFAYPLLGLLCARDQLDVNVVPDILQGLPVYWIIHQLEELLLKVIGGLCSQFGVEAFLILLYPSILRNFAIYLSSGLVSLLKSIFIGSKAIMSLVLFIDF